MQVEYEHCSSETATQGVCVAGDVWEALKTLY